MKVSEITTSILAEYVRTEVSDNLLTPLFNAAKNYVMSVTGLSETQLDTHEDLSAVIMLLCADMYDNRLLTLPGNVPNQIVSMILNAHKPS